MFPSVCLFVVGELQRKIWRPTDGSSFFWSSRCTWGLSRPSKLWLVSPTQILQVGVPLPRSRRIALCGDASRLLHETTGIHCINAFLHGLCGNVGGGFAGDNQADRELLSLLCSLLSDVLPGHFLSPEDSCGYERDQSRLGLDYRRADDSGPSPTTPRSRLRGDADGGCYKTFRF